jgi:hypothetical protein
MPTTSFFPSPSTSAMSGGDAVHCSHIVVFTSGHAPVCER